MILVHSYHGCHYTIVVILDRDMAMVVMMTWLSQPVNYKLLSSSRSLLSSSWSWWGAERIEHHIDHEDEIRWSYSCVNLPQMPLTTSSLISDVDIHTHSETLSRIRLLVLSYHVDKHRVISSASWNHCSHYWTPKHTVWKRFDSDVNFWFRRTHTTYLICN